jgi:hypothetical protein
MMMMVLKMPTSYYLKLSRKEGINLATYADLVVTILTTVNVMIAIYQ